MGRTMGKAAAWLLASAGVLLAARTAHAQGACDGLTTSRAVLRASRDTRIMQTHRSSNDGAAGLVWLKRSPHVRGIVGFDLSCLDLTPGQIACAALELSVHEGQPTKKGSWFSAHRMNADWVEGNQSFNRLRSNGQSLGTFGGTGTGTTWDCRVDADLASGGTSDCSEADRWLGGEDCGGASCYAPSSTDDVLWASKDEEVLSFDVTADLSAPSDDVSWLLKVRDETSSSGSVKFYTRNGAEFLAEVDPDLGESALDLAPRLVLYGTSVGAPGVDLITPIQPTGDPAPTVVIRQSNPSTGDAAGWRNQTTGASGTLQAGPSQTWSATIPLALGLNTIEFTVFDACGGEGRAVFEIRHATGEICGDYVLGPDEECDDGNTEDGDCCSSTCTLEEEANSCDDEDPCTVSSSCGAGECVFGEAQPASCGNSHLCYRASETNGTGDFVERPGVFVGTVFGSRLYDVKRLASVCVPGEIASAPIVDAESHRVAYEVKRAPGQSKPPTRKDVQVTDALGTLDLDVLGADTLLTSAALERGGLPGAPAPGLADPYLCHKIKASGFPSGVTVRVADAFEDRLYDVKKPNRLCLAAAVGGAPPANPGLHLVCYKAVRSSGEAKHDKIVGELSTRDIFGLLQVDTRVETDLCLPATLE